MHRVLGHPRGGRHGAHRPLGLVFGLLVERLVYDRRHLLVINGAGRPRTQLVIQAHETLLHKALAPLSNRRRRGGQAAGNGLVGPPVGGQQNNLCTTDETVGRRA